MHQTIVHAENTRETWDAYGNPGGAHFATQGGIIICFNVFDMFVVFLLSTVIGQGIHAFHPCIESRR